jgi:hypothetical protein
MSRKKPGSKQRRLKTARGIPGVSLSLAGGASASTAMSAPYAASPLLYDERAADVILATFHFFGEKIHFFAKESAFGIAAGAGAGNSGAGAGSGRITLGTVMAAGTGD